MSVVVDTYEHEIEQLKAENQRLKVKIHDLLACLPDTRQMMIARTSAEGELQGNFKRS